MSYEELFKKTNDKKNWCLKNNYKYIQIWGCEWNKIRINNKLLEKHIVDINNIFTIL